MYSIVGDGMKKLLFLSFLTLVGSLNLAAYNFTDADNFFEQRDNSVPNIKRAMKEYRRALPRVRGDELVHAVSKLAHLAYYHGDLLLPSDALDQRVEIFSQCMKDVERISPENLGKKHPAFFYWKATCWGLWGQAAGQWKALPKIGEFKDALREGVALKESKGYHGGGIYRVAAATYVKSKMMALLGLYNPKKAWKFVNYAVKLGPHHYGVYLIKAEILVELGKVDKAKDVLRKLRALLQSKINTGTLNKDTAAEDKITLRRAGDMLQKL